MRVLCRALAVLLLRNLRTQAAHGLFGLKPGSIAFPDVPRAALAGANLTLQNRLN